MADVTLQDDTLYDTDFHAWTQQQAAILRDMAQRRVASPLDLAHLAEEVEDLGRSELHAVESQCRRIIEHLLKLEFARAEQPRAGWMRSVANARVELESRLTRSLANELRGRMEVHFGHARREAALGLREYGELQAAEALPESCPYDFDRICTHDWYPECRWRLENE
jgi:hypothetical protein